MIPLVVLATMANYRGTDAGFLTRLVRTWATRITGVVCPGCDGAGVLATIEQVPR